MKAVVLVLLLGVVLAEETVRTSETDRVCDELILGRRLRGRTGGVTVRVYNSDNQLMTGTETAQPNQAISVMVTLPLGSDARRLEIQNSTGVLRLSRPVAMARNVMCKEGDSSSQLGDVIRWTWVLPGFGVNTSGSFDINTRIFFRKVMNDGTKGQAESVEHNSITLALAAGEQRPTTAMSHGPGEVPGGYKPADDETPAPGQKTTTAAGTGEDPHQADQIKAAERNSSAAADAAGEAADKKVTTHDSKVEAYMAAKYAEQKEKMAKMEDANSEGTWQKQAEKQKKEHEKEMKEEMEDFERTQAEEEREREARIREEIRDKEEHDKLEMDRAVAATSRPAGGNSMSDQVEADEDSNVIDMAQGGSVTSGAARISTAIAAILASLILMAI